MIVVTEEQVDHVRYLLEQAIRGNHILFDLSSIKRAITRRKSRKPWDHPEKIEVHLEKLMTLPTLNEKKAYLEQIDEDTLTQVADAYLKIVENSAQEVKSFSH